MTIGLDDGTADGLVGGVPLALSQRRTTEADTNCLLNKFRS